MIRTKFNGYSRDGTRKYYKSAPDAPPPPDYKGAAEQTAAGNLDAARASASANRVNQITPYGSVDWTKKPGSGPDDGWVQSTYLSPVQQQLLDQQNKTSLGLGGLADQGLGYVKDALGNPVNPASLQAGMSYLPADQVNAGQTGQDALMARFQPQIDQSHAALETQLANQGIAKGSEAYDNAMRTQGQSENDLKMQAALNGIKVGNDAQNQKMGLYNQQLSLQSALQNAPINILNAVRTGSQVTNPQFSGYAQQGQTAGPDYSGAAGQQNTYNMGLYNSGVAGANAGNGAAMSAVGTVATVAAMF